MSCRWPSFIKRPFKLHRTNQQSWYFTAIGVFTMNTYFANSSEVVNIIFFYFGVRVISNSTLEHKRSRLIRSNWFWCAYQGKCTTAVTPKTHGDPKLWRALFKQIKLLGKFMRFGQRSKNNPIKTFCTSRLSVYFKLACRQPNNNKRWLI